MYRLFELFGTKWIDAVDVKTLEEIKELLPEESKKEGLSHFRIDIDDVPITFCETNEQAINYCIETIDTIEQYIMYMHTVSDDICHKIESSRPSRHKSKMNKPKKTTRKHLKKMIRSNNRKKRNYR